MEGDAPPRKPRRDRWKELVASSVTETAAFDTAPKTTGKGSPRRRAVTLQELPLFADERSLSDAVLGRGKYTHWRAVVPLLERRGFPTIDGLMGGRYWPAVKAFFDREYRVDAAYHVSAPDGREDLGAMQRIREARKAAKRKGYVEKDLSR
jgi:hypothetical protein